MNQNDKLITEEIDKYLLEEGWFSTPKVTILSWNDATNSLNAVSEDGQKMYVVPTIKHMKIKNLKGFYDTNKGKRKEEKVTLADNQEGLYFHGGEIQNGYYWAWNLHEGVIYYSIDRNTNTPIATNGQPIQIYCSPVTNTEQQGGSNYGYGYTNGDKTNQGGYSYGSNARSGNARGGNNNQGEMIGDVPSNYSGVNLPSIDQIINPNEAYPLSNAILRLDRSGYIQNSLRARNLINDLREIGY